jgi:hypothetical protein
MTDLQDTEARQESVPGTSWLYRPLSGWWCGIGCLAAFAVFMGGVRFLGGPSEEDAVESIYSTWALAHFRVACAYPSASHYHFPVIARPAPLIAPLWPLLSGALAALTRIGHQVPFPSNAALGPNCSEAQAAIFRWSVRSGAALPTVSLGYASWLVLMAGIVALLRASGRGRCGWEPAVLVLVACVPSVWTPLVQDFHPQDLVAMGLGLCGLACARRGWWAWAGVLLALAITSQQFALLVIAPLVIIVPQNRRFRFVGTVIGTASIVILPIVMISSGRALRAVFLGSGNSASIGGTVLWELHFHGGLLVLVSRVLPIVCSMALAWWAHQRLGHTLMDPVPLLSLIATSLSLRLVFEENLFGYYFMALAVSLVVLEAVSGRIRGQLVAWIVLIPLAFNPVPWGFVSNSVAWGLQDREYLPAICIGVALVLVARDALRGRVRGYLVAWTVLVTVTCGRWPWSAPPFHTQPIWFWQIVLVSTGVALAVRPLLSVARSRSGLVPEARPLARL